jgi:predicted signal transduction protein with EAL and GGDEF domain
VFLDAREEPHVRQVTMMQSFPFTPGGLVGLAAASAIAVVWLAWKVRRAEARRRESELEILDLTEQSRATEALLAHRALHDPLTDLANRPLFLDRLGHALTRARRPGSFTAVLLIGLDRFRSINDRLGHAAGDRLLAEAGARLRRTLRVEDTVARVAGDEFAVLVERLAGAGDALKAAERALSTFEVPFDPPFDGRVADRDGREGADPDVRSAPVRLTASIGIASAPPSDSQRPEDLMRDAGIALRVAKREGGARIHLFDTTTDGDEVARLAIETELWGAAERGELTVLYQPIVRLSDQRLAGVEALLRWDHPRLGFLPPDEFISLAEESGAIAPIGRWVLDEVCRQVRAWAEEAPDGLPPEVSINLSERQFHLSRVAEEVSSALDRWRLPPSALCFEITESLALRAPDPIRRLRALGVRVALDDFATGYSSLGTVKTVAVDSLKIDRSFVAGLGSERADTALVTALVRLGRDLGLVVTAEGVETEKQLHALLELGCQNGQGHLFAPALPAAAVSSYLAPSGKIGPVESIPPARSAGAGLG